MSNKKPQTYMIGNWKMNQNISQVKEFFKGFSENGLTEGNHWVAPQSIHIHSCLELTQNLHVKIGAQNASNQDNGAFTGEVAAVNLKEIGAHFCLVGHSERRAIFGETDELVNSKTKKLMDNGLIPVVCIGETLEQREAGKTLDIVLNQVKEGLKGISIDSEDQLILAYEPVWAIGTGKTATPEQAEEVHAEIRKVLIELYPAHGESISILYGGSVKPGNVADLVSQPNINGGLVGGASLTHDNFSDLCKA